MSASETAATPPSGPYVPPGTYPAPGQPPAEVHLPDAPPPVAEPKPRRVGVFTMSICLIAVGVLLLLYTIFPAFNILAVLRFSPVVLVLLGAEMLLSVAVFKGQRLRYDFLSVFLSLLLIGGSLCAAAVPHVIHRDYETQKVQAQLEAALAKESYEAAKDLPVSDISWSVALWNDDVSADMQAKDIADAQQVAVYVDMPGKYQTPEAFARDSEKLMELLHGLVPHINRAVIHGYESERGGNQGNTVYSLRFENIHQTAYTAAQMLEIVETEHWMEAERYYAGADDYAYRQAHPEQFEPYPDAYEDMEDPEDYDDV